MNIFSKVIAFFVAKKERIGIILIGFFGIIGSSYVFDYFLYPLVIWKFGILKGGAVMMVLSGLICYAIILFYDWTKKDWLGIETIKEIKDSKGESWVGRFFRWIVRRSDGILLVFLSIKFDPLITMLYMRNGAYQYNGLNRRDWTIFIISIVIGNVYWTLAAYMGVSAVEYVWKYVTNA